MYIFRLGVSRCVSPDSDPGGGPRPGCQCQGCYAQPRPGEASPLYGSGRSQFYVNSDSEAHETLRKEASGHSSSVRTPDKSLHLAHSTFYRDTRTSGTVVPVPATSPDPHPIVPVDAPGPPSGISGRRECQMFHRRSNNPRRLTPVSDTAVKLMDKNKVRRLKWVFQGCQMQRCVKLKGATFLAVSRITHSAQSVSKIRNYRCNF